MGMMSVCNSTTAAATAAALPLLLGGSSSLDLLPPRRRKSSRISRLNSLNVREKKPRCVVFSKLHGDGEESSPPNSGLMEVFERANEHVAKIALATAVASLVIFSPPQDAIAAKSGGRVGGQAFRSAPPPPRAGPRIDNSRRTNIYVNPPTFVAPPLYGNPYYGGYGWSPFSFFFPGPSVAVGVGGGFNFVGLFAFMIIASSIFNFFRRRNDDNDGDYYD